jgi:predicted RNase H-like HicB family nuclease
MSHFIALIHKEIDSGFGVSFPDVPGVVAISGTLDDAIREGSVALGFAFEDWQGPLPQPRTLDELRLDEEFRQWSTDAVVAAIEPASRMADAAE